MRRLTVALACAALAFSPGCGGDDESGDEPPAAPVPTVPKSDSSPDAEPAPDTSSDPPPVDPAPEPEPVPTAPEPAPDPGGAVAPTEPEPPPDSPTNDTPPPPGSEDAEEFEKFCDSNPGACG